MKHLEKFENNNEPKVGDWVICKVEDVYNTGDWFDNNLGQIISIEREFVSSTSVNLFYMVKCYPKSRTNKEIWKTLLQISMGKGYDYIEIEEDEIVHFSDDKEKLESYLQAKKFNI